ncbi:MAG: hypothetical protein KF773_39855 [Deltaproteobacteria bacterium]|nr:hypothetical protein [Deltaproteobacteria bacterium]
MQPSDPITKPPFASTERRATVRLDAQGVWLDLGHGKRWVADERARGLWISFADREVLVTGHCYRPFRRVPARPGIEAIDATHFRVETLRFAGPPGDVPYLAMGPERWIRGEFRALEFPAGSVRAGEREPRFFDEYGTGFHVAGLSAAPQDGAALLLARVVERNPAYTATTAGDDVWILEVHGARAEPRPARDTPIDCPP